MHIIFSVYLFIIYIIHVYPCKSGCFGKDKGYSEICEKAIYENESNTYCMKDHLIRKSLFIYKPIMKLLLKKYRLRNNKIAIVEHAYGEPQNFITYGRFFRKVLSLSHALNNFEGQGIQGKSYKEHQNRGWFRLLGIYGSNSINWLIADMAAMMSGVTSLILHSKFSIDVIVNILNETKLEWLCLDLDLVDGLLLRRHELPYLKKLIILDNLVKPIRIDILRYVFNNENNVSEYDDGSDDDENSEESDESFEINMGLAEYDVEKLEKIKDLKERSKYVGIRFLEFDDVSSVPTKIYNIQNEEPDFITSIVYTSGTSGKPKGVMLSNLNMYNAIVPLCKHSMLNYHPKAHLSYLPVSHIYERINVYVAFLCGIKIDIWSKNINFFSRDMFNSKGELLVGVPKVFNRIYSNIMAEINNLSDIKRRNIKNVFSLRRSVNCDCFTDLLEGITGYSTKIRNCVNPNLEVILNGGGKLSPRIAEELRVILNVNFYQGYGLTETTGPIFVQQRRDYNTESMGGPISPNTKYKVRTWETYKASDSTPKGELLIKSDSIFKGYFLERELTENSFTYDRFFVTGDIVQINDNGSLTFLDRSKGLVKLSQGEYIETDLLNNIYSEIPFINHCVVYGDDSLDEALAIISVDKYLLYRCLRDDNMLNDTGINENNYLDKLSDKNLNTKYFINYVKNKMLEVYNNTNLNRYNIINHIYLTSKTWDTTNYLTPTMKVKRFSVIQDYAFFIDQVKNIFKKKLKGQTQHTQHLKKETSGEQEKKNDENHQQKSKKSFFSRLSQKRKSRSQEKNESKSEEKNESKSEEKSESKSEEKNESKSEEKNESKSEEKNKSKSEEKNKSKSKEKNKSKSKEKNKSKSKEKNKSTLPQDNISIPVQNKIEKSQQNNMSNITLKSTLKSADASLKIPEKNKVQTNKSKSKEKNKSKSKEKNTSTLPQDNISIPVQNKIEKPQQNNMSNITLKSTLKSADASLKIPEKNKVQSNKSKFQVQTEREELEMNS
ncbi:acyl-CoA synthetase [Plasmodium reichenowi]|uniref:Acyl-CoA synthetase n=1 Tax=Plasmodium reichenowi TaxID=5854 RepID=A0A2P9D4X2_PLARE|nr:acyl-CoA synthetase [Plasmodium reichenowi]